KAMSVLGVVLGIIGIYLLVSQNEVVSKEGSVIGMVMIFFCLVSWAAGSLFVGNADLPKNYFVNTGYQMLAGGLMLALGSLIFGEIWTLPNAWSKEVQWSMGLLIVFGSIVAF